MCFVAIIPAVVISVAQPHFLDAFARPWAAVVIVDL